MRRAPLIILSLILIFQIVAGPIVLYREDTSEDSIRDTIVVDPPDSELFGSEGTRLDGPADSSCPMFRGNAQRTGVCPVDTTDNPGMVKWTFQPNTAWVWSSPVVDMNGDIYFGSPDEHLYAVYPNGTMKWKFYLKDGVEGSAAIGDDDIVYFSGLDGSFYALYPNNGTVKWKLDHCGSHSSPAIGDDGIIYIGSAGLTAVYPNGTKKWSTGLQTYIGSVSIGPDGTLYIGDYDYYMNALYPNGTIKWRFRTGGYISNTPAVDNESNIYFGSWDGYFYSVDKNGSENWKYYMPGTHNNDFHSSPAIDPFGNIYCDGPDNYLYTFFQNGTIKNKRISVGLGWSSITFDNKGNFFLGTSSGTTIYAIWSNGTFKWAVDARGNFRATPAIGPDGTVYAVSESGILYAIGESKPQPPTLTLDSSGNEFVHINWTHPIDHNAPELESITLFRQVNGGGFELYQTLPGDALEFNDTGLENGLTYSYYLTSTNMYGESDYSNIISAVPLTVPSAPEIISVDFGDSFIDIVWGPSSYNGGAEIIDYHLYRNDGSGNWENIFSNLDIFHYNDTYVTNGVEYSYKVVSENIAGYSEPSEVVSRVPMTIPNAPAVYVQSGDGYNEISWTPPEDDGGTRIINYIISRRLEGAQPVIVQTADRYTDSWTDTDVENGISYYYDVMAENEMGRSPRSELVLGMPVGPPTVPLNPSVVYEDGINVLSWDEPEKDGGAEIIGYQVYVRTSERPEEFSYSVIAPNTTYEDNFITKGVEHFYSVSAINSEGESDKSVVVSIIPTTVPGVPTDLDISYGDGFVHIYWSGPIDTGGLDITGYRIYRKEGPSEMQELILLDGDTNEYNDTSVDNGVIYTYWISAVNSRGDSGRSGELTGRPFKEEGPEIKTVPSHPRNLTARGGGDFILLEWDGPETDGGSQITAYRIYRGTSQGAEEFLVEVGPQIYQYNDTMLPGGPYYYQISAVNDIGEGPYSDEISVELQEIEEDGNGEENGFPWVVFVIVIAVISVLAGALIFLLLFFKKRGGPGEKQGEEEGPNGTNMEGTGFMKEGTMSNMPRSFQYAENK